MSAVIATILYGQQSDEVKQKPLEIRKADAAASPSPDESPTPKKKSAKKKTSPSPKPKAKPSETPDNRDDESPSPSPKKKSSAVKAKPTESPDESEATPKPKPKKSPSASPSKSAKKKTAAAKEKGKGKAKKKPTPKDDETPAPTKRSSPKPSETPSTEPSASAPNALSVPTPSAPPAPRSTSTFVAPPVEEPEQLTIEKSGYDRPRGFWSRLFGDGGRSSGSTSSGAGFRYLTRSVRAEIDRAPADRRNPRWQMIVVHNSGTRQGNARVFDYYHKHVRHMQNGLAYHFVIGNGTSTGNGQIEVGDRWRRQINGGHVHSDYLNNIALGICLVGDFNRDQPTRAQLDCCEELIRYLRQRCGKIDNHYPVVKPHREANPPRWGTDCPGDSFPYPWFRRFRE